MSAGKLAAQVRAGENFRDLSFLENQWEGVF